MKFDKFGACNFPNDNLVDYGYTLEELIEKREDIIDTGCDDFTEFAHYYVDSIGVEHMGRETLERYFNYTAFGRDIELEGHFANTRYGIFELDLK